jgi:hypothetical protein
MNNENNKVKEKYFFIPYYHNGSGFWGLLLYFFMEKLFKGKSFKGLFKSLMKLSLIVSILTPMFLVGWFGLSVIKPSLEESNITLVEILKNEIDQQKLNKFKSTLEERSSFLDKPNDTPTIDEVFEEINKHSEEGIERGLKELDEMNKRNEIYRKKGLYMLKE